MAKAGQLHLPSCNLFSFFEIVTVHFKNECLYFSNSATATLSRAVIDATTKPPGAGTGATTKPPGAATGATTKPPGEKDAYDPPLVS